MSPFPSYDKVHSVRGQCQARVRPGARSESAAPISRRGVLGTGALLVGAGAAGFASPAAAMAKVPQSQAGYKPAPNGGNECDKCLQFQPPSACKIVAGVISPSGSCDFFGPKPK